MCTVSLYTINEGENKMKKKKNDKFAVACAFEILHKCISIDHMTNYLKNVLKTMIYQMSF